MSSSNGEGLISKVPHTRIGKHVRFTEEHLAMIIAAGEQPVLAPPRTREGTTARTKL